MEIKRAGVFAQLCVSMSCKMVVLRALIIGFILALYCVPCVADSSYPDSSSPSVTQSNTTTPEATSEIIPETTTETPTTDSAAPVAKPDTDNFDQGLFEDALPQAKLPKAKPGEWMVSLSADIIFNYTFFDSAKDNVKVTYHVELGGPMTAQASMIRGSAKIKTDVEGYLAKWNTGQCLLQVNIADVPYELTVVREGDTQLQLGLTFKQKILEDWQSLCTFLDSPDSRFYTKGEPEKWIGEALQKADPDLKEFSMAISDKEKTSTEFKISKYTVKDGNIGSADISGSGTITVTPPVHPPEDKK